MPRSSLFTYIAVIIVLIGTVSCTPVAPAPPRQNANSGILPTPDATPFLSPAPLAFQEDWKTYTAPEHGFSFRYPANLEISHYQTSGSPHISISIGEQIYIWSSDFNPLDCRGDCSPVEATEPIVIAGMEAIKVTGYIGAMEATPQRYLKYIMRQGSRYYSFTLYALGLGFNNSCGSVVCPLQEEDIALFEQIMTTVKFTD